MFSTLRQCSSFLSGTLGFITGAAGLTAAVLATIAGTRSRIGFELVTLVFFLVALITSRRASPRRVGFNTDHPNQTISGETLLWGACCLITAAVAATDFLLRWNALIPLATIDGAHFLYGRHEFAQYEKWPFRKPTDRDNTRANDEFDKATDLPLPPKDEREAYRKRADIDSYQNSETLTKAALENFYTSPLPEHFLFTLRKTALCDSLRIKDLIVVVDDFEPIPPPTQGGEGDIAVNNRYMIVFEISSLNESLPWSFSPSYLLDDGQERAVKPWNRVAIRLDSQLPTDCIAIITSRKPGIYTYHVDMVVEDSAGCTQRIPVIPRAHPRKVFYEWNEPTDTDKPVNPGTSTPDP